MLAAESVASTPPETTVFRCLSRWGVDLTKTPSDRTCLGEPPVRFLWCWLLFFLRCRFFDVYCCCFYVSGLLFHATSTPLWLLKPVKVSTSSELYPGYFQLLYFTVYHQRYGFGWAFFTQKRFLPYAHSCHNLLISRPPWQPAVLPWCLLLKTQNRPICLFDSQQSTIMIYRRIRI